MRQIIVVVAALTLGCGTLQPAVAPEALTSIPAKPYPLQMRPGKDGKCSSSPVIVTLNGGCWVQVNVPLEECNFDEKAEVYTPLFIYKGACIMPMLDTDRREPTSSTSGPSSEVSTGIASKPWPSQVRPGQDGNCGRHIRTLNGGCWVAVDGACLYPVFDVSPVREPTS